MKGFHLSKRFTFDAAHKIPWHKGKCKNLHGHTYILEVCVSSDILDSEYFVVDFGIIKDIVNEIIIDKCDHQYLNDIFEVTTVEFLTRQFFQDIKQALVEKELGVEVSSITLYETPTSFCIYYGE